MADRPCMHDDGYPAEPGKRKCKWHLLLKMPMEDQIEAAGARRAVWDQLHRGMSPTSRMSKALWPDGERWCAPCQGFVPLFYASGSRCKAHSSLAAHSGRLVATYGITREDYEALLVLQGGRCAVCLQLPKTKRLAVDHDHKTNEVRGLLCADVERGCNHAVLGSLEARSVDGVVAAAYRLIDYIENPPYRRLKEPADVLSERQGSELPHDDGGAGGAGVFAPGGRLGPTPKAPADATPVVDSDEWVDFRSWLKS